MNSDNRKRTHLKNGRLRNKKLCEKADVINSHSQKDFRAEKVKGERGEDFVFDFHISDGWEVLRFRFPKELSDTVFDQSLKDAFRRAHFFKFDGLIKKGSQVYVVDIKTKSQHYFVVNKADYDFYFKVSQFIPFRIFFHIKSTGEIFVHDVRNPLREPRLKTQFEWNGNITYVIPRNEVQPAYPEQLDPQCPHLILDNKGYANCLFNRDAPSLCTPYACPRKSRGGLE